MRISDKNCHEIIHLLIKNGCTKTGDQVATLLLTLFMYAEQNDLPREEAWKDFEQVYMSFRKSDDQESPDCTAVKH